MKNTVATFQKMKEKGEKIAMLTAYDYSTAKLEEAAGLNGILVGDSLGNVMMGYENTIPVTVDNMITYGASVVRGTKDTMVVIDMPFMSYQVSVEQAVENAGRIMKETGCAAVKLEGGAAVAKQIRAIVDAGIPVMAHIGMTPQSVNAFGGFKVQGKNAAAAQRIVDDARIIQEAGAFSVVLECVPAKLAAFITKVLDIPTIGIGASNECDGQILVYQDMLGLFSDYIPKFVKHFAKLGDQMTEAFKNYCDEVRTQTFPQESQYFKIDDEVISQLH